MKNLKYVYGNFQNDSLGQEKHFKHVFGVGVGLEYERIWIIIKNIRASAIGVLFINIYLDRKLPYICLQEDNTFQALD